MKEKPGIAGLSAALAAATKGPVVLAAKSSFMESNTTYAQGGIAAAVFAADSPTITSTGEAVMHTVPGTVSFTLVKLLTI